MMTPESTNHKSPGGDTRPPSVPEKLVEYTKNGTLISKSALLPAHAGR